jgi:Protein of unknown function (DUF2505)
MRTTFFIPRVFSAPVKFELLHTFDAPIQAVTTTILDRAYQESLDPIGPLKSRTLLSQEERDGRVVRKVRCVLDLEFAGPAKSILGSADPAWIEESVWFPEETAWKWEVIPEVAASILSASGALQLFTEGDATRRVVSGDVTVGVPFLGRAVERSIVEGVTKVYDEEAERLTAWLQKSR